MAQWQSCVPGIKSWEISDTIGIYIWACMPSLVIILIAINIIFHHIASVHPQVLISGNSLENSGK